MEQLTITEKDGANYKLFELKGGLNAYTLGEFEQKLYATVAKGNVVIDMENLVELDSTGLGMLMAAFNDSVDSNNKLYFLSISPEVDRAISETGFKSEFNLIQSITEAL